MTAWAPKRFWTAATVEPDGADWTVRLDGRGVRTPAKAPLVVPTRRLAEAIAAEWQAQRGTIDPRAMPFTRSANAAIDKVTPQFDAVAGLLADYGDSDLLCYRATGPEALAARQAAAWDPLLAWADTALGAPLRPVSGVIHSPQPPESLRALGTRVFALTPFELTAFHDLVDICRARWWSVSRRSRAGRIATCCGACRISTRPGRRRSGGTTRRPPSCWKRDAGTLSTLADSSPSHVPPGRLAAPVSQAAQSPGDQGCAISVPRK